MKKDSYRVVLPKAPRCCLEGCDLKRLVGKIGVVVHVAAGYFDLNFGKETWSFCGKCSRPATKKEARVEQFIRTLKYE